MIINKNERKYCGVLRRLAKFDTFNTLKVTVCEGEINEENEQIFIAPLMYFDSGKDLDNKKSCQELNEKIIENSTEQSEISCGNKNESIDDYPDSSDFSDDE